MEARGMLTLQQKPIRGKAFAGRQIWLCLLLWQEAERTA
jgi:hypothetical protein